MPFRNKRGISSIIATLLLIVLTIVLVVIVWSVVNGLVTQKISQSTACFGNFNSISLNGQYTCYNSSSSSNYLQFSLNIGDVAVDGVLISISSPSQSESITLTNTPQTISNLSYYNGGGTTVALPGKNSGITYIYTWVGSDAPRSIQIAPIVKGQQCASSDSITTISPCYLLS
jgi:flagellin-like protein